MNKYESLTTMVANWIEDRPTLKDNNNILRTAELLLGEAGECLVAAAIYALNRTEHNKKELAKELADVLIFALSLLHQLNIDPYYEVAEKTAFNNLRYPATNFDGHITYEEARQNGKKLQAEILKDFS